MLVDFVYVGLLPKMIPGKICVSISAPKAWPGVLEFISGGIVETPDGEVQVFNDEKITQVFPMSKLFWFSTN